MSAILHLRRSSRATASVILAAVSAAGPIEAQDCPNPLLTPPSVSVSVSIEGCDYVSALAEPRHRGDCAAKMRAVMGDTTSRLHVFSRSLADTLRGIFASQFGFLRWDAKPGSSRWSIRVRVAQPAPGTPSTLELALYDSATLTTTSEPLQFEKYDVLDSIYLEQRNQLPGSLERTRARWAREIAELLAKNDGFNRSKLVKSVLRRVPLTPAPVAPSAPQGPFVWARVPVRDTDLRVEPQHRPTFEWQVDSVQMIVPGSPPDTTVDPGVFVLGECIAGSRGYNCKMLRLDYGAAKFETVQLADFLRSSPRLLPPMALYVVDYRPARQACALRGMIPR